MGLPDLGGSFKLPGNLHIRASGHNLPSLTMPSTPNISNTLSRSSLSPPLSPEHQHSRVRTYS
jgi:hypothetical protein